MFPKPGQFEHPLHPDLVFKSKDEQVSQVGAIQLKVGQFWEQEREVLRVKLDKPNLRTASLEKEMATQSSVLAWRIPGTEKPGGLPSMGSHRVGHDRSDLAAAAAGACRFGVKTLRVRFSD